MKVVVMNFSGNVGKSTISRHLLAPRIGASVISIESINSDGEENDGAIRGKQFQSLMDALSLEDNAVVDVGASNVEDFISRMQSFSGSHEDFDLYVVPTVAKTKQLKDTISTIQTLANIGVPPEKIKVIFNMVESDENPAEVFEGLINYAETAKTCIVSPGLILRTNELFGKLKGSNNSIDAILSDTTDFKAAIKSVYDPREKIRLSQALGLKRLAMGVKAELDQVFTILCTEI
jgi:hypothetical protein